MTYDIAETIRSMPRTIQLCTQLEGISMGSCESFQTWIIFAEKLIRMAYEEGRIDEDFFVKVSKELGVDWRPTEGPMT